MTEGDIKHRLAALLGADVVGYSRLMAQDEVAIFRTLSACGDKITTLVRDNDDRVAWICGRRTERRANVSSQSVRL